MWKEFYIDRVGPIQPEGWVSCSWAVEELIRAEDQAFAKNNGKESIPDTLARTHLLDIPLEQARLNDDLYYERENLIGKFEFAFWAIGQRAFTGRMPTACRAKSGGGMLEMPIDWWGIDDFWPRLSHCALNPSDPFNIEAEPTHWIFLEDKSFRWLVDDERIVRGLKPKYVRRWTPNAEEWFSPTKAEHRDPTERNSVEPTSVVTSMGLTTPFIERGTAGRKTSKHIVETFLEERIAAGTVCNKLSLEAETLFLLFQQWRSNPRNAAWPKMEIGTIQNSIRARFNQHKAEISA